MASPLEQLAWSLQALALNAQDQRAVFPAFVLLGDELALGFDDARRRVARNADELDVPQAHAIDAVDQLLAEMTSKNDVELWTHEAVERASDWQRLRVLAASALKALGFPIEAPPFGLGAIYVGQGVNRSDEK